MTKVSIFLPAEQLSLFSCFIAVFHCMAWNVGQMW